MAIRSLEERIAARVFDIRKSDKSKSIGTVKKEIMKEFPDASRNEINNGFNLASKQLQKFGKEQKQIKKKTDNETESIAMQIVNQIYNENKSDTKPIEEEPYSNDELIENNTKQTVKVQNEANNSIEIKSFKKSTTIEAQGKNYSYNIIKTEDKEGVYTDVIREDGVRFSNLEELESIRQKAIEVINAEFEEGKAILNV